MHTKTNPTHVHTTHTPQLDSRQLLEGPATRHKVRPPAAATQSVMCFCLAPQALLLRFVDRNMIEMGLLLTVHTQHDTPHTNLAHNL